MKKIKELMTEAYDFNGKLSLKQAIPLGLQHVMAMFVGNLTPLLIITGACGIGAGSEYASIQVALLQNAMIIAGIVTLIQLFSIGPVGGRNRYGYSGLSSDEENIRNPCNYEGNKEPYHN